MSPTASKAIRAATVALLGAGAVAGIVVGWRQYLKADPYAEVPKVKRVADPNRTLVATGVKLRQYSNGKKVVSVQADRLTANQDRSAIVLNGLKNGQIQTPKGPLGFSANAGIANPNLRTVDASGNVHVWSKPNGLDVTSPVAQIDGKKGELRMPATLTGTVGGGRVVGQNFTYNPNAGTASLKTVNWQGKPPKDAELPAEQKKRTWNIIGENNNLANNIFTADDAWASDKEVVIMAPHVVRDMKTDVLTATGRATYRSARADIVADQIVVHRKEGFAVCTGNVVMFQKPKGEWDKPLSPDLLKPADKGPKPLQPDVPKELEGSGTSPDPVSDADRKADDALRSGKTVNQYPMNLTAAEVTYWYHKGERHAIAKGGTPTAYQRFDASRWRQAKAPEAHYDGEKEMLDLVGDKANLLVHMKNSIGDKIDTIWMTLSTKEDQKEGEEYMKCGKANVDFVDRGDSDDETAPKKGAPPVKTSPPGKGGGGSATPPPAGTAISTKGMP